MAFNGKYEIESEKNYDEFMKRLGEWGPQCTFPGGLSQSWAGSPTSWGTAGQHSGCSLLHSLSYGPTALPQAQAVKNCKAI